MGRILTPTFWVQLFLNTLLTMLMIYLIKKMFSTVDVPVVSDMIADV